MIDELMLVSDALVGVKSMFIENTAMMMQNDEFNSAISSALGDVVAPVVGMFAAAGVGAGLGYGMADSVQNQMSVGKYERSRGHQVGAALGAIGTVILAGLGYYFLIKGTNKQTASIDTSVKEIKAPEQVGQFHENNDSIAFEKAMASLPEKTAIFANYVIA